LPVRDGQLFFAVCVIETNVGERERARALQLRLRVVPPEKSGWTVFHLQLG
jgi:hypothetical protein